MGYFRELRNKPVLPPYLTIPIIDNKYVYQKNVFLTIKKSRSIFSKYNIKIKGKDGTTYFKGKNKILKKTIYSSDDKPIVTIAMADNGEKNIYLGKDETKIIAKVLPRSSNRKNKVEFTNLANGQKDAFFMDCDKRLYGCGIFHGKEKNGVPLLCRIIIDSKNPNKFNVEIASGVDNMFMILLAVFFSDRVRYKRYKNYDNNKLHQSSSSSSLKKDKKHLSSNKKLGYTTAGVAAGVAVGITAGAGVAAMGVNNQGYGNPYGVDSKNYDSDSSSSSSDSDKDKPKSNNDIDRINYKLYIERHNNHNNDNPDNENNNSESSGSEYDSYDDLDGFDVDDYEGYRNLNYEFDFDVDCGEGGDFGGGDFGGDCGGGDCGGGDCGGGD